MGEFIPAIVGPLLIVVVGLLGVRSIMRDTDRKLQELAEMRRNMGDTEFRASLGRVMRDIEIDRWMDATGGR